MSANDNYPMGVSGSHSYFNQPDPPECENKHCMATLEQEWEFCPYCGMHIDWERWDWERGEWKCS